MVGYWMHETTGVLRPVVERYLSGRALSAADCATMRAYLRQWMAGPWEGEAVGWLRLRLDELTSRPAIECWLNDARDAGIDPL